MRINQNQTLYVALFVSASLLAALKVLYVAGLINTSSFGIYTLLILGGALSNYLFGLGLIDGLITKLSKLKNEDLTKSYRDSAISAILTSGIIGLILGLLFIFVFIDLQNYNYYLVPLYCFFFLIFGLASSILLARLKSVAYAAILFAKSLITIFLLFYFSISSLDGVIIAEIMGIILSLFIFLKIEKLKKITLPNLVQIKELYNLGIPFTINTLTLNLTNNLDKWIISAFLGSYSIGIYGFASQLNTLGQSFFMMTQTYFLPRIMRSYSFEKRKESFKYCLGLSFVSILLMGLFLLLLFPFAQKAVHDFYPEYVASLNLYLPISLICISICSNHTEPLYRALNKGKEYLHIHLFILSVFLLSTIMLLPNLTIIAIAYIAAVLKLLNCVVCYLYLYFNIRKSAK